MTDCQQPCESVTSLVTQLLDAAGEVDKTDLSLLAKMHGWCESVVGVLDGGASEQHTSSVAMARGLAGTIEAIILGEVDDADGAVAQLGSTIATLRDLCHELPGLDGGPSADTDGSEADEQGACDEAARGMALVFGDEEERCEEESEAEPSVSADADVSSQPVESAKQPPCEGSDGEDDEPPYVQQPLVIDASEAEFVRGFTEEAAEHIEAIESALLEVERDPDDVGRIDDLFRPFHTIKGAAGFLNLRDINSLTHEVETLLDQGRKGKRAMTSGVIDLVFSVVDILKLQFAGVNGFLEDPSVGEAQQPPIVDMIAYLRSIIAGRVEPEGREPAPGGSGRPVGENLVAQGSAPQEAVQYALDVQRKGKADKKLGEILRETQVVSARDVSQAVRAQTSRGATTQAVVEKTVRIDTNKLDGLVDMVGELVIAQTQVGANEATQRDPRLAKNVTQVTKIVRDVQEVAMSMRMVPIGPTFTKMARLVRDVSRKAGKKVELTISGEDTELDKNVIQQIGDPLVHMVRNAVDHGIESTGDRRSVGKNETGLIHLGAYHQGGNIVIEIRDDGKGLDRDALIRKATERGVITPDAELTDNQAFQLIFEPGLSTAKKVTDISGRGVGMDVVKRNLEQLRGTVEIQSELGVGSTFWIRLPLTLAIIDGMVVRAGSERFIIPTVAIEQAIRPEPHQLTSVQQRGQFMTLRGRHIPLIQLGMLFGFTKRVDPCASMVVVAQAGKGAIGLVVEELLGQQQVVIKSLGERFKKLRGVSGVAILGDGRVGLILEMTGLLGEHKRSKYITCSMPQACDAAIAPEAMIPPASLPLVEQTVEPVMATVVEECN